MTDILHRDTPLVDKTGDLLPDANVLVKPGFGLDTVTPGGLYLGQNNATSINIPTNVGGNVVNTDGAQTITGVKSYSAAPIYQAGFSVSAGALAMFGTGDNVNNDQATTIGSVIDLRKGTAASPDTADGALVKISRTVNLTSGTEAGDGGWAGAGITVQTTNATTSVVPQTAIHALAKSQSTAAAVGALMADAVGVYSTAYVTGAGTHVAMGGAFMGVNASSAAGAQGLVNGLQVLAVNQTANDATVQAAGYSGGGILIWTGNSFNKVATGIEFTNAGVGGHGAKAGLFDVGIHFNGAVSNGLTGPIDTASIQDDSTGAYSLLVNGTHASAAIAVKAGAGPILIGGTSALVASNLFEVQGPASNKDPLVQIGSLANNNAYSVYLRNNSGITKWAVAAAADQFGTGTIAGDGVLQAGTANKFLHLGGTTSVIKVGNDNTLTFLATTATPAGGSTAAKFAMGSGPGPGVYFGSGAPTVSAPKGSLYLRTDGTTTNDRAFINTNGTTTWTALTTVA